MNFFYLTPFFISFLLLVACLYLTWRESKLKREFELQKRDLLQKYYEVTLLNALMDMTGRSVEFSEIPAHVVAASEKFMEMSVATYCYFQDGNMYLSTTVLQGVSEQYIKRVSDITLASFQEASGVSNYTVVKHDIKNDYLSNTKSYSEQEPQSYFNVPLIHQSEIVGVICISSVQKNAFSEEDMDLLYKIVLRISAAYVGIEEYVSSQQTSLSTLVSSLPGGAMMFSMEGGEAKLTFMNSAAKQYLNIRGEASAVGVLSSFSREDDIVGKLQEAITEKKCIVISETHLLDKYFKVYINPVLKDGRDSTTVSVTLQDTTLERDIEEVRENFMHTVVHELRAPMTSIKGASDLLLNKNLQENERRKMLEMIHSQTERMLSDVSDLLDAAKIESGKLSVNVALGDINSVIKEKVETFSYLAGEKQIKITTQLGNVPSFSFDAVRIGQVINNLISNAIKYTNTGGQVRVDSNVQEGRCVVSVSDTGVGIPEEKKSLLFTKFGQAGNVASAQMGGSSGLGLYIVKGIVESHGGEIWVDSHLGQGTKVSFYLPMTESTNAQHNAEITPEGQYMSRQQVVN